MALPSVLLYPVCAAATAIGASALVYFKWPSVLIKAGVRLQMYRAGLKIKTVSLGGFTYSYAEKGKKNDDRPTMLFIHGFSSDKGAWALTAQHIPDGVHAVILDLPGHGDSSVLDNDVLTVNAQAHKVFQFVQLLGLDRHRIHVIGQSMGGAISGCFAANYPKLVSHVTLICPAMQTPEPSEFHTNIVEGKANGLIPDSVEEIESMLKMVSNKKIKVSRQFLQGILDIRREKKDFYEKLFSSLVEDAPNEPLLTAAKSIQAPSQIVWGDNDKVIHVSGVQTLKEVLPNCTRVDVLDRCGHVVNMDRPRMLANLLVQMQDNVTNSVPSPRI